MVEDRSNSSLDIVTAILSHVSLMIAGIAFIYQLSDRLNADLYSTSRINSVYSSGIVDNEFKRGFAKDQSPVEAMPPGWVPGAETVRAIFGQDFDFHPTYMRLTFGQKEFANYFTSTIDFSVCFILLFYLAIAVLCLNALRVSNRFSDKSIHRLVAAARGTTLLSILLIMTMMFSSPIFIRLG